MEQINLGIVLAVQLAFTVLAALFASSLLIWRNKLFGQDQEEVTF